VVGRFQLDEFSQLDEARLLPDEDDPELDIFGAFAHRFRVFVPAAWVRDAAAERALQQAIEAEKPAHAGGTLHLVGARCRVGVQAALGIDTILGGVPHVRLASGESDANVAPSRPPTCRLGYDTVLAPGDTGDEVPLDGGRRLGVNAVRI
jgi:hypothetical protein